eukprot:CFRG8597T1
MPSHSKDFQKSAWDLLFPLFSDISHVRTTNVDTNIEPRAPAHVNTEYISLAENASSTPMKIHTPDIDNLESVVLYVNSTETEMAACSVIERAEVLAYDVEYVNIRTCPHVCEASLEALSTDRVTAPTCLVDIQLNKHRHALIDVSAPSKLDKDRDRCEFCPMSQPSLLQIAVLHSSRIHLIVIDMFIVSVHSVEENMNINVLAPENVCGHLLSKTLRKAHLDESILKLGFSFQQDHRVLFHGTNHSDVFDKINNFIDVQQLYTEMHIRSPLDTPTSAPTLTTTHEYPTPFNSPSSEHVPAGILNTCISKCGSRVTHTDSTVRPQTHSSTQTTALNPQHSIQHANPLTLVQKDRQEQKIQKKNDRDGHKPVRKYKTNRAEMTGSNGLQACVSVILDLYMSKNKQCSDWSIRPLSPEQVRYACMDSAVLIPLYYALCDATDGLGASVGAGMGAGEVMIENYRAGSSTLVHKCGDSNGHTYTHTQTHEYILSPTYQHPVHAYYLHPQATIYKAVPKVNIWLREYVHTKTLTIENSEARRKKRAIQKQRAPRSLDSVRSMNVTLSVGEEKNINVEWSDIFYTLREMHRKRVVRALEKKSNEHEEDVEGENEKSMIVHVDNLATGVGSISMMSQKQANTRIYMGNQTYTYMRSWTRTDIHALTNEYTYGTELEYPLFVCDDQSEGLARQLRSLGLNVAFVRDFEEHRGGQGHVIENKHDNENEKLGSLTTNNAHTSTPIAGHINTHENIQSSVCTKLSPQIPKKQVNSLTPTHSDKLSFLPTEREQDEALDGTTSNQNKSPFPHTDANEHGHDVKFKDGGSDNITHSDNGNSKKSGKLTFAQKNAKHLRTWQKLIRIADTENRIILTQNKRVGLSCGAAGLRVDDLSMDMKACLAMYVVSSRDKYEQRREVVNYFKLRIRNDMLLSRCLTCNGTFAGPLKASEINVTDVPTAEVLEVEGRTFYRCTGQCKKATWQGGQFQNHMRKLAQEYSNPPCSKVLHNPKKTVLTSPSIDRYR